jgi:hypothetical protein
MKTLPLVSSSSSGADPNKLVAIKDLLANANPAIALGESLVTIRTAGFGEVLRGVSFAPGTGVMQP